MIMLRRMKRMISLMLQKTRWRLMMLRMIRARGRPMIMLRRLMLRRRRKMMMFSMVMFRRRKLMMLRRRTGPKTGDHTWCEPAQSTCTSTCQKSHFEKKF